MWQTKHGQTSKIYKNLIKLGYTPIEGKDKWDTAVYAIGQDQLLPNPENGLLQYGICFSGA